jgi:long-subunit acyl-CoA synthetase (AMP-forming)
VDTRKIIGTVMKDGKDKYYVNAEGRRYNVLLASLTYFKAKEGDEVILVIPKEKVSNWAAVESIITEEDRRDLMAQEEESAKEEEDEKEEAPESTMQSEENRKNAAIEDEWTPDMEEIKKEGTLETAGGDEGISDDFSN